MSSVDKSTNEKLVYTTLFNSCLKKNKKDVDNKKVLSILQKSKLEKSKLKELYLKSFEIHQTLKINCDCFITFCKLVCLELKGIEPKERNICKINDIPDFFLKEYDEVKPKDFKADPESWVKLDWDSKYKITEMKAREYIKILEIKLNEDISEKLTSKLVDGECLDSLLGNSETENNFKADFSLYLTQRKRQKFRLSSMVLFLHFYYLKTNFEMNVLDAMKQEHENEFKTYFNNWENNWSKSENMNEFFMKEYKNNFGKVKRNKSIAKKKQTNRTKLNAEKQGSPPAKNELKKDAKKKTNNLAKNYDSNLNHSSTTENSKSLSKLNQIVLAKLNKFKNSRVVNYEMKMENFNKKIYPLIHQKNQIKNHYDELFKIYENEIEYQTEFFTQFENLKQYVVKIKNFDFEVNDIYSLQKNESTKINITEYIKNKLNHEYSLYFSDYIHKFTTIDKMNQIINEGNNFQKKFNMKSIVLSKSIETNNKNPFDKDHSDLECDNEDIESNEISDNDLSKFGSIRRHFKEFEPKSMESKCNIFKRNKEIWYRNAEEIFGDSDESD